MIPRRSSDPEGEDFTGKRIPPTGEPWWATVLKTYGFPALVAAYLLGMLPGTRSPFDKIAEEFKAAANVMDQHERTSREALRVSRHICRGIWKGDAVMQASCGRPAENGHQ